MGAGEHPRDLDVLGIRVGAAADGTEPVQRRAAHGRGVVTVRGAADGDPPRRLLAQFHGNAGGEGEQLGGGFRFHRRPLPAAQYLQPSSVCPGGEPPHEIVYLVLRRQSRHAHVHQYLRQRGHRVARAAGRQQGGRYGGGAQDGAGGTHRGREAGDCQDLVGGLDRGVDPPLRLQARVGGLAVHHHLIMRGALTGNLDGTFFVRGRLQHEGGRATARGFLDQFPGGRGTDFLVPVDQDAHTVWGRQGGQRVEHLHQPCLHVQDPRAAGDPVEQRPGAALQGAHRPHGVVVSHQQHPRRAEDPPQVGHTIDHNRLRSRAQQPRPERADNLGAARHRGMVGREGLAAHEFRQIGQHRR